MSVKEVYSEDKMARYIQKHQDVIVCVFHKWDSPSCAPRIFFETLAKKYPQFKFIRINMDKLSYWRDKTNPEDNEPGFFIYTKGNINEIGQLRQLELEPEMKDTIAEERNGSGSSSNSIAET